VEHLESEVRLRAIPQGGSKFWRNVSILVSLVNVLSNTQAGAPRVTQSGKDAAEGHNVARAHSHIRHALDPQLPDTIQHQWTHGDSTVNPGPMWWRFRKTWVPGFEGLLEKGITNQWYNTDDITDKYVPMFCIYKLSKLMGYQNKACFPLAGHPLAPGGGQLIRVQHQHMPEKGKSSEDGAQRHTRCHLRKSGNRRCS